MTIRELAYNDWATIYRLVIKAWMKYITHPTYTKQDKKESKKLFAEYLIVNEKEKPLWLRYQRIKNEWVRS